MFNFVDIEFLKMILVFRKEKKRKNFKLISKFICFFCNLWKRGEIIGVYIILVYEICRCLSVNLVYFRIVRLFIFV